MILIRLQIMKNNTDQARLIWTTINIYSLICTYIESKMPGIANYLKAILVKWDNGSKKKVRKIKLIRTVI